ncbi:hypothetical protein [Parasitella parasitica]|uniref:Uncharacterized protein n=1 Tax=Parasitella parasitica TaxID=35722 RepID=A0A0B7NGN3_9FUNG|nr:hypothetical protein [Parasitella parasitica]
MSNDTVNNILNNDTVIPMDPMPSIWGSSENNRSGDFFTQFLLNSQTSSSSLVNNSKLDKLIQKAEQMSKAIHEIKQVVAANGLVSYQRSKSFSINGQSSEQHVQSLFDDIVNNQAKLAQIIASAKSNRGLRTLFKEADHTGIRYPSIEEKNEGIQHDQQDQREGDDLSRYESTYSLITLFCKSVYARKSHDFRFDDLSKEEKEEVGFLVEHIVLQTLGTGGCLPLHLAKDSWAVTHLLSVALRNEGMRKANVLFKRGEASSTASDVRLLSSYERNSQEENESSLTDVVSDDSTRSPEDGKGTQ